VDSIHATIKIMIMEKKPNNTVYGRRRFLAEYYRPLVGDIPRTVTEYYCRPSSASVRIANVTARLATLTEKYYAGRRKYHLTVAGTRTVGALDCEMIPLTRPNHTLITAIGLPNNRHIPNVPYR